MLRFIFSGCFLLGGILLTGQTIDASAAIDSISPRKQKVPVDWNPSLIRVGFDLASLVTSLTDDNHSKTEGMVEMDLGNWFLIGELGGETINRGTSYTYQSTGTYWRVGADVNMIPFSTGRHVLSVGVRYGRSSFDESIIDFSEANNSIMASNPTLTASWVEMTGGLRMRLWKQLYMGYQLRLRGFKKLSDENTTLQTYDIPGFGRNKRSGTSVRSGSFGFNYYVYWTIPFREKKIPPKNKF